MTPRNLVFPCTLSFLIFFTVEHAFAVTLYADQSLHKRTSGKGKGNSQDIHKTTPASGTAIPESTTSQDTVLIKSRNHSSTTTKEDDPLKSLRARGKNYKLTKKGLNLAKTMLTPEKYEKLEAQAERRRERNRKYKKALYEQRKIRFETGKQDEADIQARLNAIERKKKSRQKEKVQKKSKELKITNSAALAQLNAHQSYQWLQKIDKQIEKKPWDP